MEYVPLVYFSWLFARLYRKHNTFDISCYITLIYAVSSLFSVLMLLFGLNSGQTFNYQVSVLPTIVYCGLLTICILPFSKYSECNITTFRPVTNVKLLKSIAWIAAIYFLIYVYMSIDDIINVLTGDMSMMRNDLYHGDGEEGWMSRLGTIQRIPFSFMNMTLGCPWICVFLCFYSFAVQKLPLKYSVLFLMGSLMGPIGGIIGVDRSNTAYWLLGIGANYLMFRNYLSAKQKRLILSFLSVVVGLFIVYLTVLTIARFDMSDMGTEGSLITYFGQPYINFCYFFDNFSCDYKTPSTLLPFISKYILGVSKGGIVLEQQYISQLTGFNLGVFYTFMGHILVTEGMLMVFIFCIGFSFVSTSYNSKLYNTATIDKLYIYMILASVLFLGLFGQYYYSASSRTFSLVMFLILTRSLK